MGFEKPFDDILVKSMQETMKYLCENIQGCVFGYTQSDEISLVLTDYAELTTDAWFGNNLQKMCSVSASMATLAFNKAFEDNIAKYIDSCFDACIGYTDDVTKYTKILIDARDKGAVFDSRVFTIPKEEVCNYMIWRQQDATRNSIQSVGQANFSHKELYKKSTKDIQDMLMTRRGINWNDYATTLKRGSCCIEEFYFSGETERSHWVIDENIPIFTQNRDYVEKLI